MAEIDNVKPTKNGYAIAALVLALVALVFSWVPLFNIFSGILCVIGIALGIVGIVKIVKDEGKKAFSITALILNVVTLFVVLFFQASLMVAMHREAEGAQPIDYSVSSFDLSPGRSVDLDNGLTVSVNYVNRGVVYSYRDEDFVEVAVTIKNNSDEVIDTYPTDWRALDADYYSSCFEYVGAAEEILMPCKLHPGAEISGKLYSSENVVEVLYVTGVNESAAASWNIR